MNEIEQIRKEYGVSQEVFGRVFLGGISRSQIYFYETGRCKVPEHVMMLARMWRIILHSLHNTKAECENEKVQNR